MERPRRQQREVEVGRLALDLGLVLPLPLGHVLEVENGSALRMVEAGRPVEEADEEERGQCHRHGLKAEPPA